MPDAARPPSEGWPHLLILAPIVGLPAALWLWSRQTGEARSEMTLALRYQAIAAGVVALHLVLHAAIVGVGALFEQFPPRPGPLAELLPKILVLLMLINAVAGLAEWVALAVVGVRASRGKPYPIGGDA